MKAVKIYTTTYCPYCRRAKDLFSALQVPYEEVNVENDDAVRNEMAEKYNWFTVPMIFVGDEFIGGCDDLFELHGQGKFMEMVQAP